MNRVTLYTHFVSNVYAKLNLLGLLHVIEQCPKTAAYRIYPAVSGYAVEVLCCAGWEKAFAQTLCKEVKKLKINTNNLSIEHEGFFVQKGCTSYLPKSLKALAELSNPEEIANSLQKPTIHTRGSGREAPGLLVAPETGKYVTSSLPYRSIYFDLKDDCGIRACLLLAYLGWAIGSFKLLIMKNTIKYIFAVPSLRYASDRSTVERFYTLAKMLQSASHLIGYRLRKSGNESDVPLSQVAILALVSPFVREVFYMRENLLHDLELTIYVLEFTKSLAIRNYTSVPLGAVGQLDYHLASALLAYFADLHLLVAESAEFFELLGEYLITGNKLFYVEALRELASCYAKLTTSADKRYAASIAKFILTSLD